MPLEALYYLMRVSAEMEEERNHPIAGYETAQAGPDYPNQIIVTKEYFQSNKNGIDPQKVTDDVLGFCSLVLSYAKASKRELGEDQSAKLMLAFMPRTEFNTIFQQVKSKLPGDLFTLFESLACYKSREGGCNNIE